MLARREPRQVALLLLRRAEEEDAPCSPIDWCAPSVTASDASSAADLLHDARVAGRRRARRRRARAGSCIPKSPSSFSPSSTVVAGCACSRSIFAESTFAAKNRRTLSSIDVEVLSRSSARHLGVGEDRCSSAMTPWKRDFMKDSARSSTSSSASSGLRFEADSAALGRLRAKRELVRRDEASERSAARALGGASSALGLPPSACAARSASGVAVCHGYLMRPWYMFTSVSVMRAVMVRRSSRVRPALVELPALELGEDDALDHLLELLALGRLDGAARRLDRVDEHQDGRLLRLRLHPRVAEVLLA